MGRLAAIWLVLAAVLLLAPAPAYAQAPDLDSLPPCDFAELPAADAVRDLQVGAVIYNFTTGAGCTDNLDETFPVASVPKLFVAGAYLDWVMQGLASFTTPVTFGENYFMGGSSDCLRDENIGQSYTLGALSEVMIECSDNAATWMLMDAIGWDTVTAYVDRLGLDAVGPVIPYSEVDRLKLSYVDERWAEVPRGLASRFWRRYGVAGLVPAYFESVPDYNHQQRRTAESRYFTETTYNTATPRAMAEFLLRLRRDVQSGSGRDYQVAQWLFNTMLLTQRQYSAQALPGTVFVGAKNGFDTGLMAEVNVIFDEIGTSSPRVPSAMIIVFTRQQDVTQPGVQSPSRTEGPLRQYLRLLSADIRQTLYPNLQAPPVNRGFNLATIRFGTPDMLEHCWGTYRLSEFDPAGVDPLEACWSAYEDRVRFGTEDRLSLGLILRGLRQQDARLTFVYTAPDGQVYSYQTSRFFQDAAGVYWYHPAGTPGLWTIDVYLNLQRVYTYSLQVG